MSRNLLEGIGFFNLPDKTGKNRSRRRKMKDKIRKALSAVLGGAFMAGDKVAGLGEKLPALKAKANQLIKEAVERGEVEKGEIAGLVDEVIISAKKDLALARDTILSEVMETTNQVAKKVVRATSPPRKKRVPKK